MKRQQLFHSFLPSFTLVVLTTQPVWANNIKLNSLQPSSQLDTLSSDYFSISKSTKIFIDSESLKSKGLEQSAFISKTQSEFNFLNSGISQKTGFFSHNKNATFFSRETSNNQDEKFRLTFANHSLNNHRNTKSTSNNVVIGEKIKSPHVLLGQVNSSDSLASSNSPVKISSQTQPVVVPSSNASSLSLEALDEAKKTEKLLQAKNCISQSKNGRATTDIRLNKNGECKEIFSSKRRRPLKVSDIGQQTLAKSKKKSLIAKLRNLKEHSGETKNKYRISQTNSPEVVPPVGNPGKNYTPPPKYLNPSPNDLQYPTKPQEVRIKARKAITLAQALELARKNNREYQVSLLQLERSRGALREARAAWYPSVDLTTQLSSGQSASGQLSIEESQELGQTPEGVTDPTSTQITGDAQLTYNLYTSGLRKARVKRASEQVRLNELDVERLSEEIRLDVATDYYNLQQADEQVRIAQSAVNNAQASLQEGQALERAGVGTRFDVLRFQVNLANATQDLTTAISQQRVSRRQLATRLSLSESVNITAADKVQLAGLWNKSLEESIVLAYQNRPELYQQLAQRNINEQTRKEALAGLGPQVSFIARYELLDQFDDSIGVTDGYTVGLRAQWNLFDGGAAKARAAQAKADIRIAETQFAQQRNNVRFEVENAFSNLLSNRENIKTAETGLSQAEEALRLARLRFQAGVGTQTDVIAAESDLTRARGNRITAILDYNRALANLQRAVTLRGIR